MSSTSIHGVFKDKESFNEMLLLSWIHNEDENIMILK